MLQKLSEIGAAQNYGYFAVNEKGRAPASVAGDKTEFINVDFSSHSSSNHIYSVNGYLGHDVVKPHATPFVGKGYLAY